MPPVFPTGIKTYTRQVNKATPIIDEYHLDADDINTLQEEVEAVETELGITPSGAAATVAARLDAVEGSGHLYVVSGNKVGFEGVGGDTYIKYSTGQLEVYVDNILVDVFKTGNLDWVKTGDGVPNAWTSAVNRGFFHKMYVPCRMAITKMCFYVATPAGAGKVADVGLYNSAGARVAHTDSTLIDSAGVKTAALEYILTPGMWWFAISTNGAPNLLGSNIGSLSGDNLYSGLAETVYPLPANIPTLTASGAVIELTMRVA